MSIETQIRVDRSIASSFPVCNRVAAEVLALRRSNDEAVFKDALSRAGEESDRLQLQLGDCRKYASADDWWLRHGPTAVIGTATGAVVFGVVIGVLLKAFFTK